MYRGITAGMLAGALLIGGCAGSRPQGMPALDSARQNYDRLQQDANVQRAAGPQLARALQTLSRAETLQREGGPRAEVVHLAEIANLQLAAAQATADRQGAEVAIAGAQEERDKIAKNQREAEVRRAQSQAAAAEDKARAAQQAAREQSERADRASSELSELQAKRTQRGIELTLADVLFDTGSSNLRSGALRSVDRLAQVLTEHSDWRVLIEGFTDSQGSETTNLALSERRAEAVRQALVTRGVNGERVQVRPFGEAYPIADNATAAGRQQNRRVEIVIGEGNNAPVARRSEQ